MRKNFGQKRYVETYFLQKKMTRKTNASAGSKWRSFKASKGTFSKNCGCGNAVLGWQFWSRLFPIFQNSIPPSNLQNVLISLCAQSQTKINIMAIPDTYMAFFHPLPYFRHSVTNWFCSRQIHDSHTHMLSQFIPAWMLLQSILREEEHKKMASNAVSIKGCSYSSMIHWFVGKRVNLFSASLIIDLRRFFVKMKDLKFLLYFLANGFPPKLRKINK